MSFDVTQFLKTVTEKPGVYQMLNAKSEIIYVGKAKNLKKRLSSYFRQRLDNPKTRLMISKVMSIQVTVTHTENEALILENNLIKELTPRYNILMRDDKSYPFIMLSHHQKFPRLTFYRGRKRKGQRCFGPFPNIGAVKETLQTLQKLFYIRSCSDSYFNNRNRPCLQYQIKRCSAPCVGFISQIDYQEDLDKAILFLEGKNKLLISILNEQMKKLARQLNYEKAAQLRDKIKKLTYIQEQQFVMREAGDFDIFAIKQQFQYVCIVLLQIRDGKLLKKYHYFPKHLLAENIAMLLHDFLSQFYLVDKVIIPRQILTNIPPIDQAWLASAFTEYARHKVKIITPLRGEKKRWVELACSNVEQMLNSVIEDRLSQKKRFVELAQLLNLKSLPQKIECFDISHSQGEATVAACVVFNQQGAVKDEYRRFNIRNITPGDDYAALYQAIFRRYKKRRQLGQALPDLIIIDGGKGQLQQAINVLAELEINNIKLISIAKGIGRNPDFDVLWVANKEKLLPLPSSVIALHLVQQIRDEAHRFALTGHQQQSRKRRSRSILETIEGVGAKRRRNLLEAFNGLQGLQQASVKEIAQVSGINQVLAKKIYVILRDKV